MTIVEKKVMTMQPKRSDHSEDAIGKSSNSWTIVSG